MDLITGNALRHFYFKSGYGSNYHLTYSMDSTRADVIILGSSRAHEHYVSNIIENNLNLTCFNTGMDGNYLLNSYAVYKSIVKRYTPQIVLMDIDPGELFAGSGGYDELVSLLPYYKEKKEIRSIINLRSRFERIKVISNIYPFNSTLLTIIQGVLKKESINELKGFLPLYGNLPDTTISYKQEEGKDIDAIKMKVLEEIASDCKAKHIQLILIQSPRYATVDQKKSILLMKNLEIRQNVEFWNYVNDTMFLKPEYFKDVLHLNDVGANRFTQTISERLRLLMHL